MQTIEANKELDSSDMWSLQLSHIMCAEDVWEYARERVRMAKSYIINPVRHYLIRKLGEKLVELGVIDHFGQNDEQAIAHSLYKADVTSIISKELFRRHRTDFIEVERLEEHYTRLWGAGINAVHAELNKLAGLKLRCLEEDSCRRSWGLADCVAVRTSGPQEMLEGPSMGKLVTEIAEKVMHAVRAVLETIEIPKISWSALEEKFQKL